MSEVPQFRTVLYGVGHSLATAEAGAQRAAERLLTEEHTRGTQLTTISCDDVDMAMAAIRAEPTPVGVIFAVNGAHYKTVRDQHGAISRVLVGRNNGEKLVELTDELYVPRCVHYTYGGSPWDHRTEDKRLVRREGYDMLWDKNPYVDGYGISQDLAIAEWLVRLVRSELELRRSYDG